MRRLARDETGTGLVPMIGGFVVFLALLTFAVQLCLNLYATTAVTGAAYDAARIVAGSEAGGEESARLEAEAHARQVLGRLGEQTRFEWIVDGDDVALRVQAVNPRVVLPALGAQLGFDTVDRTVRVRREVLR
jgi:hypothetical protein